MLSIWSISTDTRICETDHLRHWPWRQIVYRKGSGRTRSLFTMFVVQQTMKLNAASYFAHISRAWTTQSQEPVTISMTKTARIVIVSPALLPSHRVFSFIKQNWSSCRHLLPNVQQIWGKTSRSNTAGGRVAKRIKALQAAPTCSGDRSSRSAPVDLTRNSPHVVCTRKSNWQQQHVSKSSETMKPMEFASALVMRQQRWSFVKERVNDKLAAREDASVQLVLGPGIARDMSKAIHPTIRNHKIRPCDIDNGPEISISALGRLLMPLSQKENIEGQTAETGEWFLFSLQVVWQRSNFVCPDPSGESRLRMRGDQ